MATQKTTLVAAFDDRFEAQRAVRELESAGFGHDEIGFVMRGGETSRGGMITDAVGTKDARGAVLGASTGAVVGGLLGAAAALVLPGVGPVVAAGILASIAGGAVAGTAVGGILGAMLGLDLSQEEAKFYEERFQEGKAIVAVKSGDRRAEAEKILHRFGGYNFRLHSTSPIPTEGPLSEP